MDVTALTSYVHKRTRTDNTTMPDTEILTELNVNYGKVIHRILDKITALDFKNDFATADLIDADTVTVPRAEGFKGMYSFPTDMLKLCKIEVTRTTGGVALPLHPIDKEDVNVALVDVQEAGYIEFDNRVMITPQPTESVTNGILYYFNERQDDLVDATDVPAFEQNFHSVIALEVSRTYFVDDPTSENAFRKDAIEGELAELYSRLDKYYATKTNRNYKLTPKQTNYGS